MSEGNRVGAIILAAGGSQRMGGQDKLFVPILGRPLLFWTLEVFQHSPLIHCMVLVLNQENLKAGEKLVAEFAMDKVVKLQTGGPRRQDSVREGLRVLPPCSWVVIHDGARPCLTPALIQQGLEEAQRHGAAIAALPVWDTIKRVGGENQIEATMDRDRLWLAQTPQVFSYGLIKQAYESQEDASDDACLVERLGHPVRVYPGSPENIKVTTAQDLVVVEALLRRRGEGGAGL